MEHGWWMQRTPEQLFERAVGSIIINPIAMHENDEMQPMEVVTKAEAGRHGLIGP